MKANIRLLAAFAVTATLALTAAQAKTVLKDTGRGERLTLVGNPPAGPAASSVNTHQGPLVEKKVVRQHVVNSKRRIIHEQAGIEQSMPQCRFVLKRDGANRQTKTVMVHLD